MSGITGIFRRDGRDVDPADIKKMNDKIAHRGPDGSRVWCEGPVAFGHQMLHTTQESLHEILPFEDKESGLVITADARIDNRKDLAFLLGIEDNEYVSDSYFILKAYEKWGEKCPEELLGDFAFAIWDTNKEELFCARDHMGVKPFYYYLSDNSFFFATEIKAIFNFSEVPHVLHEKKLAFHLLFATIDNNLTFFRNILSLKSAHRLILSSKKNEINRYWKLDEDFRVELNSDEEYIQNFREIFTEAVNCRLRSVFNVGFELSGGLDSSSIVCMAQKILNKDDKVKIDTYSLVFDDLPQVDERFFIDKVIEISDYIKPNYIYGDEINPLEHIDTILWHEEEPFYTINMSLFWSLYNKMEKNKVRVVLSGEGGDETVISHAKNYLRDLTIKMQWKKLFREINGFSKRAKKSKSNLILYHIIIYFIPSFIKVLYYKVTFQGRKRSDNLILNEEFVNKVCGKEFLKGYESGTIPDNVKTFRNFHYFAINNVAIQLGLQMIDRRASAFFIEPRYPFLDKRLIEFCYALPDEMKFRYGWNRYILRVSMDNILPKYIQWRPLKKYFDPVLKKNLLSFEKKRLDNIFNGNPLIKQYINIDLLKKIYQNFNNGLSYRDQNNLWVVIITNLWLYKYFLKKEED